jgi:hypothetical protein
VALDPALQHRLDAIRDRFELRFGPDSLTRFGVRVPGMVTSDRVLTRPPLDAAGLARIEQLHATTLPDELAAFVTTIHGGGPGPGHEGIFIPEGPRTRTAQPFLYGTADVERLIARGGRGSNPSLPLPETYDEGDWPPGPGFLELAHHGCGVFDVIVVTGEQRGQMWSCDMAWRPLYCGFLDWYENWLVR